MGFLHSLLLTGVKPENRLEHALLDFLKDRQPLEHFLEELVGSRVFVLVRGNGETPPAMVEPLAIGGAHGGPAAVIFTSPGRSSAIQKRTPDFATGLEMDFRAFMKTIPPGFGLTVNPGTFFSTEALPAGVDDLRSW